MLNNDAVKKFGEVFTPSEITEELLVGIDFSDPTLKFCEPSMGDGRILLEIKRRLSEYHTEKHIIENMLYGIEIQPEWYEHALVELNAKEYRHNFICGSALNFSGLFNPLSDWIGVMDYVIGNPPYNRNILKKEEVTSIFWEPSGYTTKLAYCCFVVMAHLVLKPGGKISYVMPVSFTHNENTAQFRGFLKSNLQIDSIEILKPDAFEGIMIRTCVFKATKGEHKNEILLRRNWRGEVYTSTTNYNSFGELPLFIGPISKTIYNKVMELSETPTAYKGWNGVDSYAKFSSSDPKKYEYLYANGVAKGEVVLFSTQYADKTKAKPNKKKNNVGCYDRFHMKKILVNEVQFGSFEATNHFKYIITDKGGNYGASPKHTVIVLDNNIDEYIADLQSPVAQLMLSVMKDYNHNDSKLFNYIPFGIRNLELTQEEKDFLDVFGTDCPVYALS